ncbi:MAG: hypothetical protein IPG42_20675 [Betaproteobacteria bacterium]|nr:hypothetical protein [Betaproteobacteria bacterium]
MKKSIVSVLGILAFATVGAASAQNLKMTPYLGVAGGFSAWNMDCAGTTDCKKNPGSARVFGGVNLSPNVAVEMTYSSLGSPVRPWLASVLASRAVARIFPEFIDSAVPRATWASL